MTNIKRYVVSDFIGSYKPKRKSFMITCGALSNFFVFSIDGIKISISYINCPSLLLDATAVYWHTFYCRVLEVGNILNMKSLGRQILSWYRSYFFKLFCLPNTVSRFSSCTLLRYLPSCLFWWWWQWHMMIL